MANTATKRVKLYEKALAMLPSFEGREIYLHDFDNEVYRTGPKHTLNGLHWGYPNSVCSDILGIDPEDNLTNKQRGETGGYYASFVDSTKDQRRYSGNGRFIKIVYTGETRRIIELGIQQKLDQSRLDEVQEREAFDAWMEVVNTKYAKFRPAALRIGWLPKSESFALRALNPDRFNHYGFGSFLEKIQPGEISISPSALRQLKGCPTRSGLTGIEIYKDMLNYGARAYELNVPYEDTSVQPGAWVKFSKLLKVEE